jgi:hypothetical protein
VVQGRFVQKESAINGEVDVKAAPNHAEIGRRGTLDLQLRAFSNKRENSR